MRAAAVFLAGFVCGVLVSTPPWARRYLLIGAVIVAAVLLLLATTNRKETPHG